MNNRVRAILGWLIVLVLFALAGLLLRRDIGALHEPSARSQIGRTAPDATVFALDGRPARVKAFAGQPLWLNFFATWCPPCKSEMPDIQSEYLRFHRDGLEIVGIDQQEPSSLVAAFVRPFRITFPLRVDRGALAQAYLVHNIPTSVFIDRQGIVRAIHVGAMTRADMEAHLKKIM